MTLNDITHSIILIWLVPFFLCALENFKGMSLKDAIDEILHDNWDIDPIGR